MQFCKQWLYWSNSPKLEGLSQKWACQFVGAYRQKIQNSLLSDLSGRSGDNYSALLPNKGYKFAARMRLLPSFSLILPLQQLPSLRPEFQQHELKEEIARRKTFRYYLPPDVGRPPSPRSCCFLAGPYRLPGPSSPTDQEDHRLRLHGN